MSSLVGGDQVFLLLYTEMAFQAFFKNKVRLFRWGYLLGWRVGW